MVTLFLSHLLTLVETFEKPIESDINCSYFTDTYFSNCYIELKKMTQKQFDIESII